ncbi:AzlC family protein [Brevibacterium casei S18]|uniref:AzlC family protein n=1 Tax=Brevibacterium casei S18 TaxID=1229781 RepID=K9AVN2_9MICO|nr:AzlC family protein [Brevibacterium casei S18]
MSSSFRTIERILPSSTYRAVAIITVTIVAVALSYGAISQVSGFAWWQTLMLAAFALGGAAEFTFVGVIAAGGAPILAVLAGLLVNSRNFAFGMAVGPFFPQDWRALIAAHWINDESTAVARTGGERPPAVAGVPPHGSGDRDHVALGCGRWAVARQRHRRRHARSRRGVPDHPLLPHPRRSAEPFDALPHTRRHPRRSLPHADPPARPRGRDLAVRLRLRRPRLVRPPSGEGEEDAQNCARPRGAQNCARLRGAWNGARPRGA